MRLLLVNPRFHESFWSFKWALDKMLPGKRAMNPPLGLATLAALCPPDWQVEIVDENIESLPLAPQADIIGICGMGVQSPRQKALLGFYRSKGYYVAAGGSYASLCPEFYDGIADTVICGEAEYMMARGILPGGASRLFHFLRSLPLASPRLLPQAITDWIMGLAMRDYVERRFGVAMISRQATASRLFESLQAALAVYLQSGKVILALKDGPAVGLHLSVSFRGWLDRSFFSRATRHLEKLLRRTPSTVTLRIELEPEADIFHLNRLLRRLAPYGDRIFIHVDAKLRELVRIDSSVFHLILE